MAFRYESFVSSVVVLRLRSQFRFNSLWNYRCYYLIKKLQHLGHGYLKSNPRLWRLNALSAVLLRSLIVCEGRNSAFCRICHWWKCIQFERFEYYMKNCSSIKEAMPQKFQRISRRFNLLEIFRNRRATCISFFVASLMVRDIRRNDMLSENMDKVQLNVLSAFKYVCLPSRQQLLVWLIVTYPLVWHEPRAW